MVYDLIIIGGGMSGISVGHFFRNRNILILERDDLLSGASGNNAGFIVSGFGEHFNRSAARWGLQRAVEIQNIHVATHRRIRELAAGFDCDYRSTGSLSVALDEEERNDLQQSGRQMHDQGYFVEWIDQPPAGLVHSMGALFNPADASIDSVRFWRRLADELPVLTQCEVRQVDQRNEIQVVITDRGIFEAEKVVFCLNAFAASLLPELSGRFIPLRGQMLELPLLYEPPTFCPILTDYGDTYWRFREKSLLFGGLEALGLEREVGIATEVSAEITEKQLEWIRSHFGPNLIAAQPVRSWCSTMAFTVDGFPFVGALARSNQYVLSGLCGLGHGYAMESASWLFELIAHDRDLIPAYCSSARIETLPVYTGGNWRKLYEAWNH